MKGKLEIISGVLRTRRYATIAASSGAGVGAIYYILTMSMLPLHLGAMSEAAPLHLAASIGLTGMVSGLAGINIAMIAFKIGSARAAGTAKSGSAVLGGAFAALTPGCPACTAPLAVILGAVGGLSIFPLQGLELKIISAGALLFSVFWVARGLQGGSCCSVRPGPS